MNTSHYFISFKKEKNTGQYIAIMPEENYNIQTTQGLCNKYEF